MLNHADCAELHRPEPNLPIFSWRRTHFENLATLRPHIRQRSWGSSCLLGAPWPRTLCWRSIIGTAAQNRRVHSFADRFGGHSLAANRCPNSSQNYHWIKAKALLAGYSIEKWMVGPNNFKLGNRQTHWYCTEQNMPKLNNLNRPARWGNQAIGASPTSMLLGRRCGPSTK
jgi:hypothetical protein